ncbi:MAG: acyl-CoA thioester hydrolase [Parasphingorhabdus sp.]|jgi:acyl-CoA thioester hydrolase
MNNKTVTINSMQGHLFQCQIQPEWIDYNGHLRDAYYGLLFSYAVDDFMLAIGITEHYRQTVGGTFYVAEDHRFYYREVRGDGFARVQNCVLDFDAKRVQLLQRLYAGDESDAAAVCESMQMHIVQKPEPKLAIMSDAIQLKLKEFTVPDAEPIADIIKIRRRT